MCAAALVLLVGCTSAGESSDQGAHSAAQTSPSAPTDVNGDGVSDFVTRAFNDRQPRAVVVFGSRDRAPVDVRDIGDRGLTITVVGSAEVAPEDPRLVGDVDRDGFGDVALTTGFGDQGYIVFGRPAGGTVRIDVRRPAPSGVTSIRGVSGDGDQLGRIEPGGDVDGDGFDDVVIPGPKRHRLASVLRGGPRLSLVRATRPSPRLVPIRATRGWQNFAVGVGNHSGDSGQDLAITTHQRGRASEMGVWVLFGLAEVRGYRLTAKRRTRTVRAASRRAGYYVPTCARARRGVGRCPADVDSVAATFVLGPPVPVGDVDADGFDDLLIESLNSQRRAVNKIHFGGGSTPMRRGPALPIVASTSVGDLDGDGIRDVLGARRGSGRVVAFHLTRTGRIGGITRIGGTDIYDIEGIGDADGDGFADLLATTDDGTALVYGAAERGTVDVNRRSDRVVRITGVG